MLPLFLGSGASWWGHAHMMIGRIAESLLTSKEKKKIEAVLRYGQHPIQTITEATTWQDDLKSTYSLSVMETWHFLDHPINKGKNTSIPPPTYNITTYMDSAYRALKDKTTTDPWVWAFHLRSLIHFVADVHTPHHNVALFNDLFPKGDAGGNGYKLNCNLGSACNNIHFLWDSAGFYFPIYNPLIPKYRAEFQKNATKLINELPQSHYTSQNMDVKTFFPEVWHNESYEVAYNFGYNTTMYGWPSKDYFTTVQTQSKERIAISGYRLGYFLKEVVGNIPVEPTSNTREIVVWVVDVVLIVLALIFVILAKKKDVKYALF